MKERNSNPRAVGDPATKAMKKRLSEMVDDPSMFRHPHADIASMHMHQLLDLAVARVHKKRAFAALLESAPTAIAEAARKAAEDLELRRLRCLSPIPGTAKPSEFCI